MNKRIFIIGLIILIIGAALFFGGLYSSETTLTDYSHSNFILKNSNEHVSDNMSIPAGYYIIIEGATGNSGLVKTSDLNKINATDLSSMEIKPSESISGESVYAGISGEYNYVVFGSSSSVKYIYAPGSSIELSGALVVIGMISGIIGFVIMILGAIRKTKPKNPDPYDIDNIQI